MQATVSVLPLLPSGFANTLKKVFNITILGFTMMTMMNQEGYLLDGLLAFEERITMYSLEKQDYVVRDRSKKRWELTNLGRSVFNVSPLLFGYEPVKIQKAKVLQFPRVPEINTHVRT